MTAARYDFTIEQGSDLDFTVQVWADKAHTAVQVLTGWDARMMIRTTRDATGSPLVSLTSSPAAGLTINGPAGQVTAHIAATVTSAYTWVNGVYDLEIFNGTPLTKRVLEGNVSVSPEVTR